MKFGLLAFAVSCTLVLSASFVWADGADPDIEAFGRQVEKIFNARDKAAVTNLLDRAALVDRALKGVGDKGDFTQGFKIGVIRRTDVTDHIVDALGKTGSYHFLRARKNKSGEPTILCRMLAGNGGLNYHDWTLQRQPDGKFRFVDLYAAISGELTSETLRRYYIMAASDAQPGLLDRLTGNDKKLAAHLTQMTSFVSEKDPASALAKYRQLPLDIRQMKSVMVLRLIAAIKVRKARPEEYLSVVADFRRMFPGDSCLDLVGLDGDIISRNFAAARQRVDHLQAFTGGDPYLDVLRGAFGVIEGGADNLQQARRDYRAAADAEPTLASAYWGLVTVSLKTKQFEETAQLLDEIQARLAVRVKDLTTVPAYADFVRSDAYRNWKARHDPQ